MSYIGLQHYGECWSSKTAAKDYDKQGPSKACVNGKYKPCKPGEFCAGKEHANYVYAISTYAFLWYKRKCSVVVGTSGS